MDTASLCKGCKHDGKDTCPVLDLSKGFRPCKGPVKEKPALKKGDETEALSDKAAKQARDPLRWIEIKGTDDWECQYCQKQFYLNGFSPYFGGYNYCPSCGIRLLPPE